MKAITGFQIRKAKIRKTILFEILIIDTTNIEPINYFKNKEQKL